MVKSLFTVVAILVLAGVSEGYDPLCYNRLTEVLGMTQARADFGIGFFSAGSYWETDTLGRDSLYEFRETLSVIRASFSGQYGLTSSHTIGFILPMYLQVSGMRDTSGVGITDPWITFDGWIERTPQIIGRAALRIPLKGALESGEYSESDRHLAIDGSLTMETPISGSSGPMISATGSLRYYFWAWDRIHGTAADSADTRPPIEFRGYGSIVLPVNPELSVRLGIEAAMRGETSARFETGDDEIPGSAFSQYDLRAGFDLDNPDISLSADVWYRLGGENTTKEWGFMLSGIDLGLGDLFGSGGGR
jgi:hypothetical protein